MKKEYLDIINKNNKVIGRATKNDIHKKGLRHRVSHLFLVDRQDRIFLQKRPKWKDFAPGVYDYSVGEHVRTGESYKGAVVRGLKEELNIRYTGPLFFFEEYNIYKRRLKKINKETVYCYILRYNQKIKVNKKEIVAGRWFTKKQIDILNKKNKIGQECRVTLKDYFKFNKNTEEIFIKFNKSNLSLQIFKDGKFVYQSKKEGIKALIEVLKKDKDKFENSIVFDKIVGRAAALLMIYARVSEVYGIIGNREAEKVFKKHRIYYKFKKTVPRILNQDKTDICPNEKLSRNKSPEKFYKAAIKKYGPIR